MTFKTIASFIVTSTCALLVTACSEEVVYRRPVPGRGHGPPAHAPAHGLRHKYVEGVELIFDVGMGVYVVVGCVDHYYYDGYFFRLHGDVWEISLYPDRDWGPLGHRSLPPGLHAKGNGKILSHERSQGNGKGPANGKGPGNSKHKKAS